MRSGPYYRLYLAAVRGVCDQAAPRCTDRWKSVRMTIAQGVLQTYGDPRVVDQCPWLLPSLLNTVRVLGRILLRRMLRRPLGQMPLPGIF